MPAALAFPPPPVSLAHRVFVLAVCLLCGAIVFDLFDLATRTGALGLPAYWMAAAGLVLSAVALAFALRDVPLPIRWKRLHGCSLQVLARLAVIALFGASWLLRAPEADIPLAALVLSLLGAALAIAAGCRRTLMPAELEPSPVGSGRCAEEDSRSSETGCVRAR